MPNEELKKQANELIRYQKREAEHIIERAIKKGIITRQEYESRYMGRYLDHHGNDSFVLLMDAKLNDVDVFLTHNIKILKKREQFQKRFGIRLVTIWEMALEKVQDEQELDKPDYIG
jgi:hypothetical protein